MNSIDATALLLETFNEAREVMGKGEHRGDGVQVPWMSELWHQGSYRALEECLPILRSELPLNWWHVTQRYLAARDAVIEVKVIRTQKGFHPEMPPNTVARGAPAVRAGYPTARIAARIYSPLVDTERVSRGVQWLATTLDARGGVWLPREILAAAA